MYFDEISIYIFLVIFGLCLGSFINVVISRLPHKGFFLSKTRSCCPVCNKPIKPYDLIPVISWFILLGKCRSCKTQISPRYPLVELSCATFSVISFARFGLDFATIIAFGTLCVLLAISLIDYDINEIPDSLVLTIGVFAIASIWLMPEVGIINRIIGLFVISVPLLILSLIINGAFGGGDIKLMAACGFLLGWQSTLLSFFIAIIIGGTLAIALMALGKRKRGDFIAFGPAICIGVAISLFFGNQIISWYLGVFLI